MQVRDFENWFLWQLWANVFNFFFTDFVWCHCFFVSICRSYADRDQLQAIYSAYLQPVLSSSLKSHPVWGAVKNVHTLAGSMVAVYEQVSGFQVLRVCSLGYAPSILIQHRHSFERARKSWYIIIYRAQNIGLQVAGPDDRPNIF